MGYDFGGAHVSLSPLVVLHRSQYEVPRTASPLVAATPITVLALYGV